jgi:Mg-chelatase subunit ChlI
LRQLISHLAKPFHRRKLPTAILHKQFRFTFLKMTMKKSSPPKKKPTSVSHASKSITNHQPNEARKKSPVFPFTAIVGQDEMKLCLLLNVIDPRIGGVLVMGHRGTGKSTTVRACRRASDD